MFLLSKSQPLRWVVIWYRRLAAFLDFIEISVLTVLCKQWQSEHMICLDHVFGFIISIENALGKERGQELKRLPCRTDMLPL